MRIFQLILLLPATMGILTSLMAEEIEVRGKVICEEKPLEGVYLVVSGKSLRRRYAVTNSKGFYSFKEVSFAADEKTLTIEISLQSAKIFRDKHGKVRKTVTVQPEQTVYNVDFVFHKGMTAFGFLKNEKGSPLVNAFVFSSSAQLPTRSGKDGYFSIGGIEPLGHCWLTIKDPQTNFGLLVKVSLVNRPGDERDLGQITFPDIAAKGTGKVKVKFGGAAQGETRGIRMLWLTELTQGWFYVAVVRTNEITLENVMPGKYVISFMRSAEIAKIVEMGRRIALELPKLLVFPVEQGENQLDLTISKIEQAWKTYEEALRDAQDQPHK